MSIYNKESGTYAISGNNNYAWSSEKNTFYLISDLLNYVRSNNWPEDAIEVSDSIFEEFASFQNKDGLIRGSGKDGLPAWVDAPKKTEQELLEEAESYRTAQITQASLDIGMLTDAEADGSITPQEKGLLAALKKYRLALRRLDLTSEYNWPEQPK